MAKSYEEILKELQEKTKDFSYTPVEQRTTKKMVGDNSVTNTISLPTARNNFLQSKQNLQNQKNILTTNIQNKGIQTNRYSQDNLPTYNTIRSNALNDFNLKRDYSVIKNIAPNNNLDQFNTMMYQNYQKTDEFKNQFENVQKARDDYGYALYDYNVAKIANEEVTGFDKSIGTLFRGLLNFTDVGPKVRDGKGGYIELPSYNDLKQQQVQESYDDDFWGNLGKVLNSATFEVGRIGTSTIANTVAPGAGSVAYFGSMLRDSVQSAKNDGYSGKEALIYGTLSTALEIGAEKLLGGTTKALTGGKASALNQGIATGLSRIMNNKGVVNLLSHAGAEATEEFIQEFADKALRNVTLGEDNEVFSKETLSDAIYSAAVGGVTGAFGSIGDNSLNITTRNDQLNSNQSSINNMLQSNTENIPVMNSEGNLVNLNAYQYIKSDNVKIDNLRKSVSKYFNNSQETQSFVNTIENIISDKDYNVTFDNTLKSKNGNSVNAQITTNKNGEVEIKINPNSNRAGEFLLVHEITHAIETDNMKKLVLDYASKNSEFNTALESLKQTYGTNDVNSEVLADISGQLFGNQEFIDNLSVEQPNIFRRIYNKIIELANKITGNSHEALFIRDLRNKWENAYRNTTTEQAVNNLNTNTVFSIQTDANGNRYVNVDTDQDIFAGKSLVEQNKIAKKYILDHFRGNELTYNNENINVNNKTATKYTNPQEKITRNNKNVKNRISTELDNLLSVSEKISESTDKKSHAFAKDGWEYYKTTFNIDGNYFTGILNIGKNGTQKTLYDITNIKKTTQNGKLDNSSVISNKSSFSDNNITNSKENVKLPSTRYSMQENQNDTNIQRYDDLSKTNYIEYFRKDNGDVRVNLIDSNNNLINQLDLWSNTEAIKQFGEKLGNQLYNYATDNNQKINIGNDINNLGLETDYFMSHRPTQTGLTADNLINQNVETPMPKDIYNHPEYYFQMSEKSSQESMSVLRKVRGNPNAEITIYRATPGSKINRGDWITLSKSYAKWHNQSQFDGKANVLEMRVKAKDVQYAGDDINEFGYFPDGDIKNSISNKTWQEYLEENYRLTGTGTNMQDIRLPIAQDFYNRTNSKKYSLDETQKKQINELDNDIQKHIEKYKKQYPNDKNMRDKKIKGYIMQAYAKRRELIQGNLLIPVEGGLTESELARKIEKLRSNYVGKNVLVEGKNGKVIGNSFGKIGVEFEDGTQQYFEKSQITPVDDIDKIISDQKKKYQKQAKIPTAQDIQRVENINIDLPNPNRVLNPLEISQLNPEDASTTPPLPNVRRNRVNDGNSSFASNIQNKTNMLNEEQKGTILSDEEVRYYDKITNKESLEKAFEKLNNNGRHETESWFAKDSENATATDVAEGWILLKQYADNNDSDGMVAVAKKLRDMGTKAGQTVQAFNIMARMTPEGMVKYAQSELSEAYDRMVKGKTKKWIEQHQKDFDLTPQETGAIMDIMKKVSTMEDGYDKRVELAKIQKIMTDKLPPAKGAGIKSWMRISMLFNPKTQVRNVMGNAVIAPVNAFGDLFASMADKVIGSKTGYRTTGVTNIQNYVKGFKEGLYQSYNDFKQGINTRNIEGNRFEISEGKSFNDNTAIGKSLNKVDSLLSFMLDAGDRAFYEATFVNSINNQLVLNNTTNVTQEMIDIATQEALSRTWQDNNNYTRFVLSVRKMMNNIHVGGYGLGDVLIPFAKTPANLTKAIVDYSPVGVVTTLIKGKNLKNAIETGQFTPQMQHDFVQSLGKATVGTMLYVAGYALAKAGVVSGESDDDKDVRDFMKNTLGVNSYSIKIGDKSFTYDWAQPIAAPLSIMANIVQKDKEDASTLEKVISSLDTAGNILLEQSFMESINTALSNNDGLATGIEEAILDLPARAVPTLMKQIVDLTDSTQRQSFEYDKPIQSMINSVKAKIPGLSQTLAPSVDTMGREIQRYGGKNNIFNVFLNPANVSTENISESAGEIYRLYKETGNTNIMPRVAPYYINRDGEKITLNSSQRAQYQKASGNIIEKEIEKLLNNSQYNKMSDEKKSEVISDIVNYSYNVAQKEVLGTELSDTYQKVYAYSKIGDVSDYYAFRNSIDDTDNDTKKESITNYLLNSTLSDKELAALYGSYYSSEETLEDMMTLNIPIKEYIKLDSQEFTTDYDSNGKAITNSKKNKIINYVNSLNLSIPQKAILIKSQYSSYDSYDKQIVNYVNSQNLSKFDKATLLKSIGFDDYNSYIVEEVNSRNISAKEKEEILDDLGFRIVNGRVYW